MYLYLKGKVFNRVHLRVKSSIQSRYVPLRAVDAKHSYYQCMPLLMVVAPSGPTGAGDGMGQFQRWSTKRGDEGSAIPGERSRLVAEDELRGGKILLSVDADCVDGGGLYVDRDAVLKETELFELLGVLKCAHGQAGVSGEGGSPVGIEADVLPVRRVNPAAICLAVVGDGCAREVERTTIDSGDHFDHIWVGDGSGGAGDPEGGDIDVRVLEGSKEGRDMLRLDEGFVALDINVDIGWNLLGDGLNTIGSAGKAGGGHLEGPAAVSTKIGDLLGVGGDDGGGEAWATKGGFVDPGEHGLPGDGSKNFSGKAGGGEACGDNAEHARGWLLGRMRIQYDWYCVCQR